MFRVRHRQAVYRARGLPYDLYLADEKSIPPHQRFTKSWCGGIVHASKNERLKMEKMSKDGFLCRLNRAICQASLNRRGKFLEGYQVRDAIDCIGLPIPPFKNLNKADEELEHSHDPIFRAVNELSDAGTLQNKTELSLVSPIFPMMLAELAWRYYELLFPLVRGGTR